MAPQTEQKIYVGIGLDFETGGLDCRECACTQIALQAVRFDTWQVFDRYQAYIAPYGKQDAGLPRRHWTIPPLPWRCCARRVWT